MTSGMQAHWMEELDPGLRMNAPRPVSPAGSGDAAYDQHSDGCPEEGDQQSERYDNGHPRLSG